MRKLLAGLGRVDRVVPSPRVVLLDGAVLAGGFCVLHGIDLIYPPAAWIVGGLAAMATAALLHRGKS